MQNLRWKNGKSKDFSTLKASNVKCVIPTSVASLNYHFSGCSNIHSNVVIVPLVLYKLRWIIKKSNNDFKIQQCVKFTEDLQFLGMADTPCGTCVCSETLPHQMLEPCLKQTVCQSSNEVEKNPTKLSHLWRHPKFGNEIDDWAEKYSILHFYICIWCI